MRFDGLTVSRRYGLTVSRFDGDAVSRRYGLTV